MGWKMQRSSCGVFRSCLMFAVPVLLKGWDGARVWHFGNGRGKRSFCLPSHSRKKRVPFTSGLHACASQQSHRFTALLLQSGCFP